MQQFFVWLITQLWAIIGQLVTSVVDWGSAAWDFVVSGFASFGDALREWLNGQMPTFIVDAVAGTPLDPFVEYYNLFAWFLPLNLLFGIVVNTYAATATVRLLRHLLGFYPGSLG